MDKHQGARERIETSETNNVCRFLIERSPLPMAAVSGPAHIVEYANPAFCRLLEKKREDVIGFPFADVLPEAKDYLASLERVRRTGEAEFGQENRQSPEQCGYWAYGFWAILNAAQNPIGVMIHLSDSADSTQRERAADMNQELMLSAVRQHELNEELHNLLQSMFDNAPMAVYFKDLQGHFTGVNRQAEQTMGIHPDEALDKPANELFPEEMTEPSAQSDRRVVETGLPVQQEEVMPTPDGERWLLSSKFPLRDASQNIIGLCGMSMDITERKRMERQLQEAKDLADFANAAKDQFLAVLSHELRTPLTPVLVAVSKLQRAPGLDASTEETLRIIRRNVEMEARLIDDLLDLTRIAQGKVELKKQPHDLVEIIQQAVEVCEADTLERRVELHCDAPGGHCPVMADGTRLRQVFWNLLQNAAKFSPPDGRISIRCHCTGDEFVEVQITDNGCGITQDTLSRLFRPFEQGGSQTTRRFGGLGLGLVISKALVEQHAGTIEARSDGEGKGTTVTVRLPLIPPATDPLQQDQDGTVQPQPANERHLRILYVEDHADTAQLMRELLEMEGHLVHTAGDVSTALEAAAHEDFDVLVSDLGLPDGTGIDLMRELRDRGQALPGIVLSGYGLDHNIQESRDTGFAQHLVKPVGVDELLDALAHISQ